VAKADCGQTKDIKSGDITYKATYKCEANKYMMSALAAGLTSLALM